LESPQELLKKRFASDSLTVKSGRFDPAEDARLPGRGVVASGTERGVKTH